MPYLPEIITAFVFLALIIYFTLIRPKHKQIKLHLLALFRAVRNRSLQLQDKLSRRILEDNAADVAIQPGTTYEEYLIKLRREHDDCFTSITYAKLLNGNRSEMRKSKRLLNDFSRKLAETEKQLMHI